MGKGLGISISLAAILAATGWSTEVAAQDGVLFRLSGDHSLTADVAGGAAQPTFADKVRVIETGGASGGYIQADDDQVLAWSAPGNIYAQRGTIAFDWRSRYPVGRNPFPVFRVGYADHSSWDMAWLRIDWNGEGFDAFVTDANLSRVRVSYKMPQAPAPDQWTRIAFTWDEAEGVKLYINGQLAAENLAPALLDAGLDQFGPHSRIISPMQVQSRYNFLRGGDVDELIIYDHALSAAQLAGGSAASSQAPNWQATWNRRLGFDGAPPPYIADAQTAIRRVEFTDQRDVAERMWKGNDGIRETTWPGVYNRSRLNGRHDYFTLPDWNVYSMGGQSAAWFLPDEPWNQVEIQGAAHGRLSVLPGATVPEGAGQVTDDGQLLARRAEGVERSTTRLTGDQRGGAVRFINDAQETPIEEIGVYHVGQGAAPVGVGSYAFTIRPGVEPDFVATQGIQSFIRGRYPIEERATVAAVPTGADLPPRAAPLAEARPIVHVIVPMDFRRQSPGQPLWRGATYGYENAGGLDGVELTIPPLQLQAGRGGLIPLNIRIKDPLAPQRDLMDVNVSVKPGETRTLWLDTRDRILGPDQSIYFTVASSNPGFNTASLDGARVRLVFKSADDARAEHVHDRWQQVRDNYGFLVEERQSNRSLGLFERFYEDLTDLLRVDPTNAAGQAYWSEWNPQQPLPAFIQPQPPAGVPLWAFRQAEALKQARHFVNWWIDHRQVDGEFGGGLSDDTDLMNQWPGLALMGVDTDKLTGSLGQLIEATHRNGMWTNGLGTITTDELHVYEEGVNAISQMSYLTADDPLNVERLMATAARYSDLTAVNPAGHRHFISNYFSGEEIIRETPWQWQKGQSVLILHPGIRLVDYNGSPQLKRLLLDIADGYLAHGKADANGRMTWPTEVNWPDDAERGGADPQQMELLLFAAWRWTGDEKYLAPLRGALRDEGVSALTTVVTTDPGIEMGDANLTGAAARGDRAELERTYGRLIHSAAIRMPMMTDDQWWTDRVEIPTGDLQRARLGGVALMRNQIVQGNRISWRFADPDGAEKLAVMVREPTATGFRVVAWNLSNAEVQATVEGAQITHGRWRVTIGPDADGDDRPDAGSPSREFAFGQGRAVDLPFAPGATVAVFEMIEAAPDVRDRADAAVMTRDLVWNRGALSATVHSLGSQPTPAGHLRLFAEDGTLLAEAPLDVMEAPNDLRPRTQTVALRPRSDANLSGAWVRVELGGMPEISDDNNRAPVPAR